MDARDQKIRELEYANAMLQFRVEALEVATGKHEGFAGLPHLTPTQQKLLAFLARFGARSRDQLYAAMYGDRLDPPEMKIIDVLVCKLRRALGSYGIDIQTKWGWGYELPPASRRIALDAMRAHEKQQKLPHETAA